MFFNLQYLLAALLSCHVVLIRGRRLHAGPYYEWYNYEEEDNAEPKNPLLTIPPCLLGTYRELGNNHLRIPGGLRGEGCIPCPAGRYGDSTNLTNSQCSGACPRGSYLDYSGAKSIDECKPCPEGTYGEQSGLTTEQCSGQCIDMNTKSTKYYSDVKGIQSKASCKGK